MASSSPLPLLLLVLLLALASSTVAVARGDNLQMEHLVVYMHESMTGRNATLRVVVESPLGKDSFGQYGVVDNELRDCPDWSCSTIYGRFQGIFALAGLVSPPGMQSVINFVFTRGRFQGSSINIMGPVLDYESTVERAIVGGTGVFRMARGYTFMRPLPRYSIPNKYSVYRLDLFVQVYPTLDRLPLLPPLDSVVVAASHI